MSIVPCSPTSRRRGEHGVAVVEMVAVAVLVLAIVVVVWFATGRIERQGSAVECRNELRAVKIAVMNYESLNGQPPTRTDELLDTKDPVRGGRLLDDRPDHYEVGPDGVVVRKGGSWSGCPSP